MVHWPAYRLLSSMFLLCPVWKFMVASPKSPNICLDLVLEKSFFRGYQSRPVTMLSVTAQLAMQELPECFLLVSLFQVLAMSSMQVPTDMPASFSLVLYNYWSLLLPFCSHCPCILKMFIGQVLVYIFLQVERMLFVSLYVTSPCHVLCASYNWHAGRLLILYIIT